MKNAYRHLVAVGVIVFLTAAHFCFGQGTAFTYQGLLNESNGPANGSYDLTFKLFTAASGGSQTGSTIADTATPVSNGLFTVILDFGAQYSGASYWLQIGVRTNGAASYTALTPRQELTPTPYAITAENLDGNLSASQLIGTLPAGVLSGTYGDALTLNNAGNSFTGNGSGLTGIDALTLGGLGPNDFWKTTGNAGTTPGINFLGTTDGHALELSAPFVGVNRTTAVTGSDVFSVTSPATNGSYGGMYVDTGSGGWPFYGYSIAGNEVAYTFIDASFYNQWYLYNNGYWLTVATNGYVGIDTETPEAPLDLGSGNHWDVYNAGTAGDFRIGDGTQGLKIGVATGGAGAGDTRIFAFGGTSHLILGSSTYDGVVTVVSNTVGINTLTPAAYASLDVESTNDDGIYATASSVNGNGIYATANSGGSAYAVWGVSDSGYGVVGGGAGGTGVGVYGYSYVSTNGTGVLAQAADSASPALSIATGGFQVKGAGMDTGTTAFTHLSTAGNIAGDWTTISNPLCDGDPNAILIVTHNYNPGANQLNTRHNHPIGVWYTGSNWAIYNEDAASMVANVAFNVLVIKP